MSDIIYITSFSTFRQANKAYMQFSYQIEMLQEKREKGEIKEFLLL